MAPARFNREGPTFIPPTPPDYVKQVVLMGATVAMGFAIYAAVRPRDKRCPGDDANDTL